MSDSNAFAMQDFLGADFYHLLFGPVFGPVFGLASSRHERRFARDGRQPARGKRALGRPADPAS
jgi:hypothetical protein